MIVSAAKMTDSAAKMTDSAAKMTVPAAKMTVPAAQEVVHMRSGGILLALNRLSLHQTLSA